MIHRRSYSALLGSISSLGHTILVLSNNYSLYMYPLKACRKLTLSINPMLFLPSCYSDWAVIFSSMYLSWRTFTKHHRKSLFSFFYYCIRQLLLYYISLQLTQLPVWLKHLTIYIFSPHERVVLRIIVLQGRQKRCLRLQNDIKAVHF